MKGLVLKVGVGVLLGAGSMLLAAPAAKATVCPEQNCNSNKDTCTGTQVYDHQDPLGYNCQLCDGKCSGVMVYSSTTYYKCTDYNPPKIRQVVFVMATTTTPCP